MNITLSVDDKPVNDARKIASDMGKNLNQIIREYLENLTRQQKAEADAATRKLSVPVETARRKIELLSSRTDVFSIAPEDIVQAIDIHRLHSLKSPLTLRIQHR
ncbi:hypothetical protein [Thiothrix nivea]|uniref:Uncharacterized protein n=1 Tax=Thiothrix nivea (strain ATCC 35100 / DSM 5205 / JP2) TaxID=870187 RepID=A0A656HIU4_THINJ|nr:hypothetical protein [Thiothrix nivea]EIJ35149.1 hypothetical protein Thini_2609 [Thiothrix nivea DSM 5205]